MNRREFLKSAALAGATSVVPSAGADDSSGPFVRFCVFSDLHYWPRCYPNDSTDFLDRILQRAVDAKCDFVIHCGDMVHDCVKYRDFVDRYLDFGKVPTYYCLGNHEDEFQTHEETMRSLRLEKEYYSFDVRGFRFIVTDPHWIRRNGELIHFSKWNWSGPNRQKGDEIYWLPPDQVDWLRQTIDSSPYPCVVFSHESFERPVCCGGVRNQEEVRRIFADANRACPGKVRMAVNGHYHVDFLRLWDDVAYLDVNSANYFYSGRRHTAYPADWVRNHGGASLTYAYDAPLSSVVTLYPGGRITIDGSRANWCFGVRPEDGGHSGSLDGRPATCVSQSADFCLTVGKRG